LATPVQMEKFSFSCHTPLITSLKTITLTQSDFGRVFDGLNGVGYKVVLTHMGNLWQPLVVWWKGM